MSDRLEHQLRFILEIDRLKSIIRRSYLASGERLENSAEHSWHLAMMALVLSEYANEPIDLLRVVKLLLVHDIVEIDAGDTYCYDEQGAIDKLQREQRAAERIFGLLPQDQAQEMRQLWQEFENGTSPEARFAAGLDRLMPLLHNYHTHGRSWQEHGITSQQVLDRNAGIGLGSQKLWETARAIIADAVARGYLSEGVAAQTKTEPSGD